MRALDLINAVGFGIFDQKELAIIPEHRSSNGGLEFLVKIGAAAKMSVFNVRNPGRRHEVEDQPEVATLS